MLQSFSHRFTCAVRERSEAAAPAGWVLSLPASPLPHPSQSCLPSGLHILCFCPSARVSPALRHSGRWWPRATSLFSLLKGASDASGTLWDFYNRCANTRGLGHTVSPSPSLQACRRWASSVSGPASTPSKCPHPSMLTRASNLAGDGHAGPP